MKKDLVDYEYLSDNVRYADLFNGALFGGEQVIMPEGLVEKDSRGTCGEKGKRRARTRDLIRKCGKDMNYAVLGVENQEEVSYIMPLRMMEYEVTEYRKQVTEIKKQNQGVEDMSAGEFLERFRKDDKLNPCVSLVLFWGKEWDASVSLKEMMNLKGIPSGFAQYVNDYAVHVVHVRKVEDTSVFKTDLKQVFDFLKCAEDKDAMKRLVMENEEYRHLDMDAYDVMIAHAHSEELEAMRDNFKEDDGDMCKALQDWAAEEREIGRGEGREEGRKEILLALVADGSLSLQRAAEGLNLSVEELQACMKEWELSFQR